MSEKLMHVIDITGATIAVNTTAYANNDLVGTKITVAGELPAEGMILVGVILHDLDSQAAALDLVLFDSNPSGTTFTNNSALDIADADLPKVAGVVSIPAANYRAFADSSVATVKDFVLPIRPVSSGTFYAALASSSATPTYSANGVSLKLLFLE